eukprot:gene30156-35136_t
MLPVRVPDALQTVRAEVLEDYVRLRVTQFAGLYSRRVLQVAPPGSVSGEMLELAASDVMANMPVPENMPAPLESRSLQLVFRHDCM